MEPTFLTWDLTQHLNEEDFFDSHQSDIRIRLAKTITSAVLETELESSEETELPKSDKLHILDIKVINDQKKQIDYQKFYVEKENFLNTLYEIYPGLLEDEAYEILIDVDKAIEQLQGKADPEQEQSPADEQQELG